MASISKFFIPKSFGPEESAVLGANKKMENVPRGAIENSVKIRNYFRGVPVLGMWVDGGWAGLLPARLSDIGYSAGFARSRSRDSVERIMGGD